MTDTVTTAELIAHLTAEIARLEGEVDTERRERRRHQATAAHYRTEARDLATERDTLGDTLRGHLAAAVQASEDRPGTPVLAAAVRQARKAYRVWQDVTGEGDGRG